MRTSRLLVVATLGAACVFAQALMEQHTNTENMVRDRGQEPLGRDTLMHGRPTPESEDRGPGILHGILIDGSCPDRQNLVLRQPPETLQTKAPAEPANPAPGKPPRAGAVSAKGITVDAGTIQAERSDVMMNQVPDIFARQEDPTCAVTASTSEFAVLRDNGRLLDLDQGGNTFALQAVQSSEPGMAMMNGRGPAVKPRVTVKGWVRNHQVLVTLAVKESR